MRGGGAQGYEKLLVAGAHIAFRFRQGRKNEQFRRVRIMNRQDGCVRLSADRSPGWVAQRQEDRLIAIEEALADNCDRDFSGEFIIPEAHDLSENRNIIQAGSGVARWWG